MTAAGDLGEAGLIAAVAMGYRCFRTLFDVENEIDRQTRGAGPIGRRRPPRVAYEITRKRVDHDSLVLSVAVKVEQTTL